MDRWLAREEIVLVLLAIGLALASERAGRLERAGRNLRRHAKAGAQRVLRRLQALSPRRGAYLRRDA